MTPVIKGDWASAEAVFDDYRDYNRRGLGAVSNPPSGEPRGDEEILLAWYEYEDYSGSAYVLFRDKGELYEVESSHCSCHGNEGQWEPGRTTKEAILKRLDAGLGIKSRYYDDGTDVFASDLRRIVETL